jgi:hypothetical protein
VSALSGVESSGRKAVPYVIAAGCIFLFFFPGFSVFCKPDGKCTGKFLNGQ